MNKLWRCKRFKRFKKIKTTTKEHKDVVVGFN